MRNVIASAAVLLGIGLLGVLIVSGPVPGPVQGQETEEKEIPKEEEKEEGTTWKPAVEAKPLSPNVTRGLGWLAAHQGKDGGWGQGEESHRMGSGMAHHRDVSNVGDTCAAALALLRSGSTPAAGDYARALRRAAAFVCGKVEASDETSLWITDVRGTRLQGKLGTYIDTFLAALFLSEIVGEMKEKKEEDRVGAALSKIVAKLEGNQRGDGSWNQSGWAPILAQSLGGKALNRAAQKGVAVNPAALAKAEKYAQSQFDSKRGTFAVSGGAAGIQLYGAAASLGAMQESENTNRLREAGLRKALKKAATEQERKKLKADLDRIESNRRQLGAIQGAVVKRLGDARFIAGFGSNGGEEFLSYLQIGESFVLLGGKAWKEWDEAITKNLSRVQNQDGSWSGHHCITGRTFCTAAALLVLTVDRAKFPVSGGVRKS
jgi:hypothetical protein